MRFLWILVAAVLVGGAMVIASRWSEDPMAAANSAAPTEKVAESATESAGASSVAESVEDAPVPVVVFESVARPTSARLILRGRTEAARNVTVGADTAGRVISEPLRRGARVEKGDVLCRLDPGTRPAELAEAEAALKEATVEADAATQLNKKGYSAETTLRAREARLQAAQARLDKVQWDIEQLEIRAPFSGFLESDTAELGALLAKGSPCATVIDLDHIKVAGFVAEREVDLLSLGQKADARLINGTTAQGEISFISRVADPTTRTYTVEVTLDNPEGKLRDGMTAELSIDLPEETGHFIPQSALTLNDDGKLGVRLDVEGIVKFVPVEVLRDEADGFWVTGLPGRADVIVVGQEFVKEGRRVIGSAPEWAARQ